jgi:hypothetical protein
MQDTWYKNLLELPSLLRKVINTGKQQATYAKDAKKNEWSKLY